MPETTGKPTPQPITLFSSHAWKDQTFIEELDVYLNPLQRAGKIHNWDQRKVGAGKIRKQEIAEHLNTAQIILLLLSPDFLASEDCYDRELQRALERHEAEEAVVFAILLRPISLEDLPSRFRSIQMLPRDGLPITKWGDRDDAWQHIVKELRTVIDALAQSAPPPPPIQDPYPERIWHVPYRRNPFFTGREELLTHLHSAFTQQATGKPIALTQALAISGLGGIGKTQTALEYAHRYRQHYQAILWISAATEEALSTSFLELASVLRLQVERTQEPKQLIAAVHAWLRSHQDWLLIIDNADDISTLEAYLPQDALQGHILITTRAEAVGHYAQALQVKVMDQEEGALLLLRRAKILSLGTELEQARLKAREEAETIVKELGGLPLALDQAGAYIEETGSNFTGYLELYRTRRHELLKRRSKLPSPHPEPVATTWSLSFRLIEQANPAAAELLRVCAFLDPDEIPEELLRKQADKLGKVLAPVLADPFAFDQALEELRKFSLLRRNSETKSLSIHRLVQAVLRDELNQRQQKRLANQALEAVSAAYPEVKFETWEECKRYLPHALFCATLIEFHKLYSKSAVFLLYRLAWYLDDQGLYTQAELYLLQALTILEQLGEHDEGLLSGILSNVGLLYQKQGRYGESESLYKRALVVNEQVFGPQHPETAITLNNLGLLYRMQGRYEEAELLLVRTLTIYEQIFDLQHPLIAMTSDNLAGLYREQRRYEEAEPLYKRALMIRERMLSPQHPETAITLNNLGLLYRMQGRYEEAEPLYKRALVINEQALGSQHPQVATTLDNLAGLYLVQKRYEEAEPLFVRALATCELVFDPRHPSTAITLNNLGLLYRMQGRYEEAEPLYKRALMINEQVHGSQHPETIITQDNLTSLYRDQGRHEEAEQFRLRAEQSRTHSSHASLNSTSE